MAAIARPPIPRVRLGVLEVLVGCTAVGGGLALMTTGGGMSDTLVSRVPFHSWLVAGSALVVIVGGSQLIGGLALLANRPSAHGASYAAGLILIGWIILSLIVLRAFQPVLQLVMFAVGCLIVLMTHRLPRSEVSDPDAPDPDAY